MKKNEYGMILLLAVFFLFLLSFLSVTLLDFFQKESHSACIEKKEFNSLDQLEKSLSYLQKNFPDNCLSFCQGFLSDKKFFYEIEQLKEDTSNQVIYHFMIKANSKESFAQLNATYSISAQEIHQKEFGHWQQISWHYQ
ncbi:MAG: hypothetical protein HY939_05065 [Gammaproteobacteria bacterium]|nr:hypothetical protein [Gammaproteobacteria bacterium]